jgi:hypothetical protein
MAEHSNVARIQDGYAAFAKGDFDVLTGLFAENIVWHSGGRNQLTGDYRGREAVFGYFAKLMEVTDGTFHIDLHAVLADDEHGVALTIITASRDGKTIATNEADVMHLRHGQVTEFWTTSVDTRAFDELIG